MLSLLLFFLGFSLLSKFTCRYEGWKSQWPQTERQPQSSNLSLRHSLRWFFQEDSVNHPWEGDYYPALKIWKHFIWGKGPKIDSMTSRDSGIWWLKDQIKVSWRPFIKAKCCPYTCLHDILAPHPYLPLCSWKSLWRWNGAIVTVTHGYPQFPRVLTWCTISDRWSLMVLQVQKGSRFLCVSGWEHIVEYAKLCESTLLSMSFVTRHLQINCSWRIWIAL